MKAKESRKGAVYQNNANCNEQRGALKLYATLQLAVSFISLDELTLILVRQPPTWPDFF